MLSLNFVYGPQSIQKEEHLPFHDFFKPFLIVLLLVNRCQLDEVGTVYRFLLAQHVARVLGLRLDLLANRTPLPIHFCLPIFLGFLDILQRFLRAKVRLAVQFAREVLRMFFCVDLSHLVADFLLVYVCVLTHLLLLLSLKRMSGFDILVEL